MEAILAGLQGLSMLQGALGAAAARRRAEDRRRKLMLEYKQLLDEGIKRQEASLSRGLMGAAGAGGDAVAAMGRRLGGSLAGAGVYNSSALAGALAQAQDAQAQRIAQMAMAGRESIEDARARGLASMYQQDLGAAQADIANARQAEANTMQGIIGALSGFEKAGIFGKTRAANPAKVLSGKGGMEGWSEATRGNPAFPPFQRWSYGPWTPPVTPPNMPNIGPIGLGSGAMRLGYPPPRLLGF
jgi:hypothetical protein